MLIISEAENRKINIKCDYYYSKRIRNAVPDSNFDYEKKVWVISKENLSAIEKNFDGEIYFKTPRWVIYNEKAPDMSKMYEIKNHIDVPEMKIAPYPYQSYGIKFMVDKILQHNFVINADDVGLGKTIQAIGTMKWFIEHKGFRKVVIIAKKTVKSQWIEEINKFTDLDKTFTFVKTVDGPKNKRIENYEEIKKAERGILVSNFHNFLNDSEAIAEINADLYILDEVHTVKATDGKLNANLSRVCNGKAVINLTGTPIMSRPSDIYGIVKISSRTYFGEWEDFKDRYIVDTLSKMYYRKIVGAKNLNELRDKVQDIIIRRTEYEVSISMPKTIERTIYCEKDSTQETLDAQILAEVERNKERLNECNKKMNKMKLILKERENSILQNEYESAKAEFLKVSAVSKSSIAASQWNASDPRLFKFSESKGIQKKYGDKVEDTYKMSNKTENTISLIEKFIENDDYKVIVFSKYKTVANMLKADFDAYFNKNRKGENKFNFLIYSGAENDVARDRIVSSFKNDDNSKVLIGTEAMAEGLNLQTARFVINYDLPDTFAIYKQRIGRVRRVSSKYNSIIIYNMITKESEDIRKKEKIKQNTELENALVNIDRSQRKALIAASN